MRVRIRINDMFPGAPEGKKDHVIELQLSPSNTSRFLLDVDVLPEPGEKGIRRGGRTVIMGPYGGLTLSAP
jgi:hypothetical protein